MDEEILLIQCTDSKRDSPAAAKKLYDESDYFCKMRSYAEATGLDWYILSAKHGVVRPEETLEPYDDFGLSTDQATAIADQLANAGVSTVNIVAGKSYTETLVPELESFGITVHDGFQGMEIGERKRALKNKTRAEQNHSLI